MSRSTLPIYEILTKLKVNIAIRYVTYNVLLLHAKITQTNFIVCYNQTYIMLLIVMSHIFLQCFDTVGWLI